MEAHLAEKLSEASVAVLYVLVGGHIHIEGGLDLFDALLPQYLQRFLELGQRVDARDCEDGHAGQSVDHIGLHGSLRQDDPGSGRSGQVGPALRAAAVGLLRAGDPAELPPGDLVAPDLEPLDLPVEIAHRDQDPALLVGKGPGPRLSPVKPGYAGQVQSVALHLLRDGGSANDRRGFVSQSGDLLLGQSTAEQVLQMVWRQGQLGQQRQVCHVPGIDVGERAFVDHREFLLAGGPLSRVSQLLDQNVPHLFTWNAGADGVEVEDAAAGPAARAAEDVLCQVNVQMPFPRVGIAAGAAHVVGAASVGRVRDAEQRDHVRHVIEFHGASFPGMAELAIPSVFLNSPAVPHTRRSSGRRT